MLSWRICCNEWQIHLTYMNFLLYKSLLNFADVSCHLTILLLQVQPYLPTERHQQTLQEKIDWDRFKRKLVSSVVKETGQMAKGNLI